MGGAYAEKRKIAIVAMSVFLLLAAVAVVIIGIMTSDTESAEDELHPETAHAKRIIEAFCRPTHYKKECVSSLKAVRVNSSDDDNRHLAAEAFNQTRAEMASALDRLKSIDPGDARGRHALDVCHQVAKASVGDLERAEKSFNGYANVTDFDMFTQDLMVWTGGALTNLEVCLDSFTNASSKATDKVRGVFLKPRELVANALAIVLEINKTRKAEGGKQDNKTQNESENEGTKGHRRRLLGVAMAGVTPEWVGDQKRSLMAMNLENIKADVVVAKDGSGKVKTVREGLHLVPKKTQDAFVIHIKEGVYREHVTVNPKMTSVILIGDGPTKTIISDSKSFADGLPTYMTSTIDIDGDGFMARDIGFENTAGPEKSQAVAARVSSDYSIFYNCHFSGYHNTLYALRYRQFYRDCTISGTVDFISGDAVAVFQNCLILLRAQLPGQNSVITAQARSDSNGPGAIILQNCTIASQIGSELDQAQSKAFLGRPWKPYSRTIIMQSYIDQEIAPEGWTPFSGKVGLDSLFYAEFMNRGPGSYLSGRVKWPGMRNLTNDQAADFSPGKIFAGDDAWITNTGCPYYGNLLQATE